MSPTFDVRPATADDLDAIAELFCEHSEYIIEQGWSNPQARDVRWGVSNDGKEYLKKYIPGDDEHCSFVAISNENKMIGYLYGKMFHAAHRLDNPAAQIDNVYVAYGHRCRGVGSALIEDFTFWCRDKNVKRIIATTYAENQHARNIYEKEGMELQEVTYHIPVLAPAASTNI